MHSCSCINILFLHFLLFVFPTATTALICWLPIAPKFWLDDEWISAFISNIPRGIWCISIGPEHQKFTCIVSPDDLWTKLYVYMQIYMWCIQFWIIIHAHWKCMWLLTALFIIVWYSSPTHMDKDFHYSCIALIIILISKITD